jgi:phosphatidylinositol 4-kinase
VVRFPALIEDSVCSSEALVLLEATNFKAASIDFVGEFNANVASDFVKQYTVRQVYRNGEPGVVPSADARRPVMFATLDQPGLLSSPSTDSLQRLIAQMEGKDYTVGRVPTADVRDMLRKAATLICSSKRDQGTLIRHLVGLPFAVFTKNAIKVGMLLWTGVMGEKPELSSRMLAEIARNFEMTVDRKMGLFAEDFTMYDAFDVKMEYAPSDKEQHNLEQQTALDLLSPHLRLVQLLSSHYHANRHGNPHIQKVFLRLVRIALQGLKTATGHPLAREARFQLVLLALQVLRYSTGMTERQQIKLKDLIISAALSWFKFPPRWSFGGNKLQVKAEAHLMQDVANFLNSITAIGGQSRILRSRQDLLMLLMENEQYRLATWLYPLEHSRRYHLLPSYSARPVSDNSISVLLPVAWQEDPAIAVQLTHRFQSERLKHEVRNLIKNYPEKVMQLPDAAHILLGNMLMEDLTFQLPYLLYWAPVTPITAVTYFLQAYANNPFILQYAMRSLESYSVDITFFYVPQIVQTLRYDALGYVERFILETAKFSQLFAHQIIWNMKANAFKDEDSQIPDPVKPTLDHVMARLIDSFSDEDRSFYEREFNFFGEVTSISGKLRPYIRKSKPEKNQKIAEELAHIKVDVGVYLPSNPDGVVVDIDRQSGKSLQSHAKAPFMATFKIRRKAVDNASEHEALDRHGRRQESTSTVTKEMMQAAIFKVGDDCRQDMLALQLIAAFRSVFNSVGLDVYVFPYRVTATAPGCGVIDVLPKSISRDMLGRDYDMGLYDYFINKYGGEDSIKFQEARTCFVKSMAAYSVISYLLKFKDRHNGNIMLDDAGHIIHIGKLPPHGSRSRN